MKPIIIASILAVSSSFGEVTASFSGATSSSGGADWQIGQLVLTVSIDGSGNATVTAAKTNGTTDVDVSSFGGLGTVSAGFGETFTIQAIGRRDNGGGVVNSALRGAETEDSIGVSGGNGNKVDIVSGNSSEHVKWEVKNLASNLTFVLNSINITRANFIGPDKPSMVLTDFSGGTGIYTPNAAGTSIVTFDDFGTQDVLVDGAGAGVNGSFLTGVSGSVDGIGFGINALSFDIIEKTTLIDDDGTATTGWLSSTGDGALDTTTESGFLSFVTPDAPDPIFNQHFLKYFDPTTLAVGDFITLTTTFKITGIDGANNNNYRLRFGLFDSTGGTQQTTNGHPNTIGTGVNGYMGAFSPAAGKPTHIFQSDPANNSFMVQAVSNFETVSNTDTDGDALADGTLCTLRLTVERTASGNDLTWAMNGKEISVSASDTGGSVAPFTTFDTVAFAVLDAPNMITDWRFDSILVETTGTVAAGTDFATWITGTFANGTVTLQGPDDDDDDDGISNLLEFAIDGEDPTVPNPSIGSFTGLELSFDKRAGTTGLAYAIEQSTDLGVSDLWEAVAAAEDASSISYTLPGTNPRDFLRLKVTEE